MQIYSEKNMIARNNKAAPPGEVQAFHLNVRAFPRTNFSSCT